LRNYQVLQEWKLSPPLTPIDHFIDLGAGLSPTLDVLLDNPVSWIQLKHADLIDRSQVPRGLRQDWKPQSQKIPLFFHDSLTTKLRSSPGTLLALSYSAVEMASWPQNLPKAPHLWFIEPSVKATARKLQGQRENLIASGYSIIAPCTHSDSCPLLLRENDWCHSRVHFTPPPEFSAIEDHLRMKNSNLTFSYLLLSQSDLIQTKNPSQKRGRFVSDLFVEKGKLRQMACQSKTPVIFSWLDRDVKSENFFEAPQGSLYLSPAEKQADIETAAAYQEIRLKTPLSPIAEERKD
jgi:hypothetical protein